MGCRVLGSMCMGKLPTDRHVSPAAGYKSFSTPKRRYYHSWVKKGSHPRHFELAVQLKQPGPQHRKLLAAGS